MSTDNLGIVDGADIWLSGNAVAPQNNIENSSMSNSCDDDACIAALKERLMTDVGSWPPLLTDSVAVGSVMKPDDEPSAMMWHTPEHVASQLPTANSLLANVAETQPALRATTGSSVRRVSVDSSHSLSSQLALASSSTSTASWTMPHSLSAGQLVSSPVKPRSTTCCVGRRISDGMLPNQQLTNLHAMGRHKLAPESRIRSRSSEGDGFPFVVPRQRIHHQQHQPTTTQVVRPSAAATERMSRQQRAVADRSSESVGAKHVTFTADKVGVTATSCFFISGKHH